MLALFNPVQTPERYLELATECMDNVHTMTSLQFNRGLCQYLAIRLLLAVRIAKDCLRSSSLEPIRVCHQIFKHLFRLAKEVESFTNGCCNDQWLQAAFTLTNVSDHVASLGYDLDLCRGLLRNSILRNIKDGAAMLTLKELIGGRKVEIEIVRIRARLDQDKLLDKVKDLIQSSNSDAPECHLAKYLLGRLTAAPTMSIPSSVRSSSSSFWEVDYTSLEQVERLGTGAAGIVHKSIWLGEQVAEKTYFGSDPTFRNEILILAGLSHPNIVPLLCYAMDHRQCSIVMELMEGDLFHLMQTRLRRDRTLNTPFTVSEAVEIMLQVAEGMYYLHRNRVVHRDLKSHNILVKSAKDVDIEYVYAKVADFGLSKTKEKSSTFSNQSLNVGTTRWMAPELMWHPGAAQRRASLSNPNNVEKYPFKSDVYSFGMVCYEILTAEVPFQTTNSHSEVRNMVLDGHRPELPEHCPLSLKTLIQSCWEPDASARPCFADICGELRYLRCLLMTDAFKGTTNHMDLTFSYKLGDWRGPTLSLQDESLYVKDDLDPILDPHEQHTLQAIASLPAAQLQRASSFPVGSSLPLDEAFLECWEYSDNLTVPQRRYWAEYFARHSGAL